MTSWRYRKSCDGRFCWCSRNRDHCLYPKDGVSKVQELQMTAQTYWPYVIAIDGNFWRCPNQCQKHMFTMWRSRKLAANKVHHISQLYEHWSFGASGCLLRTPMQLVKTVQITAGEKANFLPSQQETLEISLSSFLCQTNRFLSSWKIDLCVNENNVLTDFFKTHVYDKKREFKVTTSPSWIFWSFKLGTLDFPLGRQCHKDQRIDGKPCCNRSVPSNFDADILDLFAAAYADEAETAAEIASMKRSDYIGPQP